MIKKQLEKTLKDAIKEDAKEEKVNQMVDRRLIKYRIEMNQYRALFKEYRKLYQQGITQLRDLRTEYINSIKTMKQAKKEEKTKKILDSIMSKLEIHQESNLKL